MTGSPEFPAIRDYLLQAGYKDAAANLVNEMVSKAYAGALIHAGILDVPRSVDVLREFFVAVAKSGKTAYLKEGAGMGPVVAQLAKDVAEGKYGEPGNAERSEPEKSGRGNSGGVQKSIHDGKLHRVSAPETGAGAEAAVAGILKAFSDTEGSAASLAPFGYAAKAVPATWDELVHFTQQSGKSAKKIGREIVAAVVPTALASDKAKDIAFSAIGEPALRIFEAAQLLRGVNKMFENLPAEKWVHYVHLYQTGRMAPLSAIDMAPEDTVPWHYLPIAK